ncbi:hypothetical protein OH492_24910 [Vibrio chagasii]|nr:hypothetical protein [Vibrio chagasii]
MSKVARIRLIAETTWTRNFDQLGLSPIEALNRHRVQACQRQSHC